jgi:hypothetical protein
VTTAENNSSTCIFCKRDTGRLSVEHIVPRSLGNLHYVLPKGAVCQKCNNRFGRIESHVVTSTLFLEERRRLGLIRKRSEVEGQLLSEAELIKFLMKMAYESIYKSRRKIWNRTNFAPIVDYLLHGKANALFFEKPIDDFERFKPIPGWIERFRLRNNQIHLEYKKVNEQLYFRFQFGRLERVIRVA